ncbi:IgGFc-binding protein-like [Anneissia japonica]|uniref:IgGFc-binding protein-like n=1 Tax=Anneissia japonica TaxID=1529436 RepID=UPI0014259E37|nr:IgGFc-binding protein-like [Anneissia japonica]
MNTYYRLGLRPIFRIFQYIGICFLFQAVKGYSTCQPDFRTASAENRKFTIGFMENAEKNLPLTLTFVLIGNAEEKHDLLPNIVNITSSLFEISVIQHEATETVYLPSSLVISGSRLGFIGIEISSSAEIRVFGINTASSRYLDGFLALPIEKLGCQYYVASYTRSQVLIVGIENNTSLSVLIKAEVMFDNKQIHAGQFVNLTLRRFQAAQLQSELDLSGSLITSSKPITVMAGSMCATLSSNGLHCNHLVEQLPPLESWGSTFILTSSQISRSSDLFRIFSKENNTVVTIITITTSHHTTNLTIDEGQFHEIFLSGSEHAWIETFERIMVVQYRGYFMEASGLGGPSMCVQAALETFDSSPVTLSIFDVTTDGVNRFRNSIAVFTL